MEVGGIPRRIDVPLNEFAAAIERHVGRLSPHLVITQGSNGEYGHPQHLYTHRATRLALSNSGSDISTWHDLKVAAVLCHKTQHAMFLRNTGAAAVEDMTWKTESFRIWQGSLADELRQPNIS